MIKIIKNITIIKNVILNDFKICKIMSNYNYNYE